MKSWKALLGLCMSVLLIAGSMTSCSQSAGGDPGMSANIGNGGERRQGDVYSAAITISGTTYGKTSEVVVIAETATITGADENWQTYYNPTSPSVNYKGAFIKDRTVKLSPYVMGQYEVTQQLYNAVMGRNPSKCNSATGGDYPLLSAESELQDYRPVEYVSWYDALEFCNKLTKKTMAESDCVYTITSIIRDTTTQSIRSASVTSDITKKGYRLPTEAEWEFAARGGNPSATAWKYAYAGKQTEKVATNFTSNSLDTALDTIGWYNYNLGGTTNSTEISSGTAGYGTHAVGRKDANTLGLYDMSGNVFEWCWDWDNSDVTSNDSTYTIEGVVVNPQGAASGSNRVMRGGYKESSRNAQKWLNKNVHYSLLKRQSLSL